MSHTYSKKQVESTDGWIKVMDKKGYVMINKPVYFAYNDDDEPTVKGEYTSDNTIDNPDNSDLWIKTTCMGCVSYTVVES